jgi:hypothetical protein
MWEKVLAFFNNKITKYVEWGLIGVGVIGLLIGGITTSEIGDFVGLVGTIVVAVVEIIKFVIEHVTMAKTKKLEA